MTHFRDLMWVLTHYKTQLLVVIIQNPMIPEEKTQKGKGKCQWKRDNGSLPLMNTFG